MSAALRRTLICSLLLWLSGCAGTPVTVDRDSWVRYWPPPPEPPLYEAEAHIRYVEDIRTPDRDEGMRRALGFAPPGQTPAFARPYDVAVHRGRIYVSDQGTSSVHAFDVPRRRFHRFGHRGPGRLQKPMGIAVDHALRVYVVDAGARAVQVYDALGLHLATVGSAADLVLPVAVAVTPDGGEIYVVDRGGMDSDSHRVAVFDPKGTLLRVLGGLGAEPGSLRLPMDIAVYADGRVAVLDSGNFRVQTWRPDGAPESWWGAPGSGPGDFGRPRSLAIDAEGIIYVGDSFFSDVKAFAEDGRPLLPIGGKGDGSTAGSFNLLAGIASDETGRLYAIDQATRSLHVFRRLVAVADIRRAADAD